MTIFDCFSGWQKASRCKKLIRKLQYRLKLLKNIRRSIVRTSRNDIAQLIKLGCQDLAFERAESLFKDEAVLELYELLEKFSEFTISHLSYIRMNEDCPNDINEAVSSLIFASAKIGNVPELPAIRKLFSERYGQTFQKTALELLPGNLVNSQVKEKLSIKPVPDETKMTLLQEIVKDYCLQPEISTIEFASEFHQQISHGNLSPESHQGDTISSPMIKLCSVKISEESSSESLPQVRDDSIVYLDDVEEVKHFNESDGIFRDQKEFDFKSPIKLQNDIRGSFNTTYDSGSDSDRPRRRVVKAEARRRPKRRALSRDNFKVRDIQSMIYYDEPHKNKQKRRKNSKTTTSPSTRKEEKTLSYVHPRLPDYDKIVAKFVALKKEHMYN